MKHAIQVPFFIHAFRMSERCTLHVCICSALCYSTLRPYVCLGRVKGGCEMDVTLDAMALVIMLVSLPCSPHSLCGLRQQDRDDFALELAMGDE